MTSRKGETDYVVAANTSIHRGLPGLGVVARAESERIELGRPDRFR